MLRRLSRTQLRRQRRYLSAIDMSEVALDYDAVARMAEIDRMPRTYRQLVNEHGYVPVKNCLAEGIKDIHKLRDVLAQRHQRLQTELANGWF